MKLIYCTHLDIYVYTSSNSLDGRNVGPNWSWGRGGVNQYEHSHWFSRRVILIEQYNKHLTTKRVMNTVR